MCLAIPAKIVERKDEYYATVDVMGLTREVNLRLTPDAKVGDYVLIHAGFAIQVVDEAQALDTLDLIQQFPELAGDDVELMAEKE